MSDQNTGEHAEVTSTESAEPTVVQPVDAPPAKPVRKRATRKKAVPAAAPDETVATEPVAAEPKPTEAEAAPAKPVRKRATRKKAAPAAKKTAPSADEKAPVADVPVVAVVLDEPEGPREDEEDAAAQDGSSPEIALESAAQSLLASFGVLFQAPEPAAPRPRRRATAPQAEPTQLVQDSLEEAEKEPRQEAEATVDDGDDDSAANGRRRRRGGKGRRGRGQDTEETEAESTEGAENEDDTAADRAGETDASEDDSDESSSSRRRRRRRRTGSTSGVEADEPGVVTKVRESRRRDEVTGLRGSTRLEAKKQRRREGREAGRRRTIITEAEFLARREAVERVMVVREKDDRTQIGVLEDGILVEHYIDRSSSVTMVGNIYLGRVQNVLPSMEAAFVDIGKGRNAVLYAGEVNWARAGLESGEAKRIENALEPGQTVLVQVTKDPMGHKGARLTSQISLPGRYLVYVPESNMTGISRKLPDTERSRLKRILREVLPSSAGVIVRTAAEGASEEELRADVERLTRTWEEIQARVEELATAGAGKSKGRKKNGKATAANSGASGAPLLLHGEADMTVRVIRDIFNEDFTSVIIEGEQPFTQVSQYVAKVAPDLSERVQRWSGAGDLFTVHRVTEQLAKALDRKVWLPSGGSLVIDRTEAMTVVDVNTGKFVGAGGNLEETVTRNNIEAAEEIVRQLRLRDIGGIIVIDFIDMVLESNRDLVVRRLLECLGRDRTKHQVAEVTSLGLVQMTRKRVGTGLVEVFSEQCEHCAGRGIIVYADPVDKAPSSDAPAPVGNAAPSSRRRRSRSEQPAAPPTSSATPPAPNPAAPKLAQIAAAAAKARGDEGAEEDQLADGSSVDREELTQEVAPIVQGLPTDLVRESDGDQQLDEPDVMPGDAETETSEVPRAAEVGLDALADVLLGIDVTADTGRPKRRRRGASAPAGPPPAPAD